MENARTEIMRSLPGFDFRPTDEELLIDHLKPKILSSMDGQLYHGVIPELDVRQSEPSLLPTKFNELPLRKSKNGRDLFFFCPVKHKYSTSQRTNRMTDNGYWKVTNREVSIRSDETGELIGTKKRLVFYQGGFRGAKRINWIMHEYHLNPKCLGDKDIGVQMPYVACRVKNRKDREVNSNKKGNTSANPEDYADSSSPRLSTSVNHQGQANDPGDCSSFCNYPHTSGENDQAEEHAQPQTEISVEEPMQSLVQFQPPEPYAGTDAGGNYEFDSGYMPTPRAGNESYLDIINGANT